MVNVLGDVVSFANMSEAVFVEINAMYSVATVSAAIVLMITKCACVAGACPARIGGLIVLSMVRGRGGAVVIAGVFGACPDRIGGLVVN